MLMQSSIDGIPILHWLDAYP
jgi:hypothetical protein